MTQNDIQEIKRFYSDYPVAMLHDPDGYPRGFVFDQGTDDQFKVWTSDPKAIEQVIEALDNADLKAEYEGLKAKFEASL